MRFVFAILTAAIAAAQNAPMTVLVSVDGLRPDYVLEADKHKLKIPNLRALVADGSHATGVHGVLPTVTYPSHTTMITGVSPSRHGIVSNNHFDPLRRNREGWYWYAEEIQVPTLWEAVNKAGGTTASINWPVTVAGPITWNIAQYWRAGTDPDRPLLRAVSTPGLLRDLEKELGPIADGIDESFAADANRMKFAERVIEWKRPRFTTVYIAGLDHAEHQTGPFSAGAFEALEAIDAMIGDLRAALNRASNGQGVFAVVSDHGFLPTNYDVRLNARLASAGFIDLDAQGNVKGWTASAWTSGGTAAIMINPKAPTGTRERVRAFVQELQQDPANGIDRVLDRDQVKALAGYPNAEFVVAARRGFSLGSAIAGPMVVRTGSRGSHGYLADVADMNSSLFLVGPGVTRGKDLGIVDMRDIAPTLAFLMGVEFATAEGRNVLAGR